MHASRASQLMTCSYCVCVCVYVCVCVCVCLCVCVFVCVCVCVCVCVVCDSCECDRVAMSLWLDVHACVCTWIYPVTSISISLYATGVSYFVYGEMVDVYGGDPKLKEFMDVGLKFIQSLIRIGLSLPFYRMHIYTKSYREYVDTLNKLQDCGMYCYEGLFWLMIFMNHVSMLGMQVHACPVLWCACTQACSDMLGLDEMCRVSM